MSTEPCPDPHVPDPHPVWLHRLCWLLVALVWPLIWVGGLVTTYDAGMSVPDWPGTYGYNLFLYPYRTWFFGPTDLFIEHGHRLLGAVVGLVAIAVVVAAFVGDRRRWVKYLSIVLLGMVIAQGMLGGFRVVLSDRILAMLHGCFGPAFFAVCTVALVVTSRWWFDVSTARSIGKPLGRLGNALSVAIVAMAYGQLILGAMLRHVAGTSSPSYFAGIVGLHVTGAFALWFLSAVVWILIRRAENGSLANPALALVILIAVQIVLGIATWVVNYGYPSLLAFMPDSESFLIRAKGFFDSIIVTAHVATGSLVLATAAFLATRGYRLRARRFTTQRPPQSELVPL